MVDLCLYSLHAIATAFPSHQCCPGLKAYQGHQTCDIDHRNHREQEGDDVAKGSVDFVLTRDDDLVRSNGLSKDRSSNDHGDDDANQREYGSANAASYGAGTFSVAVELRTRDPKEACDGYDWDDRQQEVVDTLQSDQAWGLP